MPRPDPPRDPRRPGDSGRTGADRAAGRRETILHVPTAAAGTTVAAHLRARQSGTAWSEVRRIIRGRRLMIDGNICTDEARRLKGGEVIKLLTAPAAAPPDAADLRIVFLDDQVVVVEKPSGITTVRHHEERSWPARRRQLQPTLDELLPAAIAKHMLASRPRAAARKSDRGKTAGKPAAGKPRRPGPVLAVHRIDRETSGLVVFARTVPAARILAEQFRQHTTHRRYLAIVRGRAKAATIRSHIARDRGDGRRGSGEEDEGKLAVTHVRVLEHYGRDFTLVECTLETGRTHQIRIHLSEAGHPLCGERVYVPRGRSNPDTSGASRVALHAAELGFVHPVSGEEIRLTSPLPKDIRDLVGKLRKGRPD